MLAQRQTPHALLRLVAAFTFSAVFAGSALANEPRTDVLVVVGAAGTEDYARQFREWSARWRVAAEQGQADFHSIGTDEPGATIDRDALQSWLAARAGKSSAPLWLVLIGHGTFDGKTAKFNLRGADFSAADLAGWLKPIERPLAFINCASASGPFLAELSGPNRVVITATKSGFEHNFSRFGSYLSAAITDPSADLDKDEQTSLLEAFVLASAQVREFFAGEVRLATEHALLDDNGDRLGTSADWFRGVRVTKAPKEGAEVDGLRAGQFLLVRSPLEADLAPAVRERRDQLERELAQLRKQEDALSQDDYLARIEPLLVEIARLYESVERREPLPEK